MRSERKRRRTFLARFMVLFMIINLLSGVNPSVVKSEEARTWGFDNNGNTSGNNQVRLVESGVESTYQDGKFDVKLEVEGSVETVTNNERLDVVLVVDRSGSMKDENRMENAKTAAKQFVDKLIDGGNGKVRVGLVSYGGKIKDKYGNEVPNYTSNPLQNNKNKLKGIIDGYNAYKGEGAGTFTQAALREANKLFEANNNKKILVLISDGLPTYSYSGGSELDFNQIKKAHKNVTKEGYEIWSIPVNKKGEYDSNEWVKGYRTDSYKTGFIWTTEWTYVPYYVKLIPVIEGAGDKTSTDDKARTIAEAKSIKDKGVRIFSVGIGVDNNGKDLLTKVATPGNYNDANSSAGNLGKLLNEIADQLKFAVSNGDLELVMNDKVEFKNADDLKKIEVKVVNKNSKKENTDKGKTIKDTAKWSAATKTLSFSGITLDKDEVLNITYKAELVETYKDGDFKSLNASAVLYPKGKQAEPNNKLNFIIPSVKDMKTVNLTINKQWAGNKVPASVESVKFNINAGNTEPEEVVEVRLNKSWIGKSSALPKYKDGKAINYTVNEVKGANYEIVGEIKKDATSEGFTFTATNRNTETINFTVKKDWSTTPKELQFDTSVQLYAGENKVDNRLKTLKAGNWTATFTDLPKYNDNGDEIKYSVKEVGDKEEKEGKLTLQGYEYSVKHDTATESNQDTITNTVTNASNKTFTAKVTKNWEGGISTNDVIFTFTNKVGANKKYDLKLTPDSLNGEYTWIGGIQLPKYNDNDNSLAEYTVTEVAVPGFTTKDGENKVVTASDPNVEFTNTRNTKNITVIKEWKDTPESLKKEVKVVLTENGEVSSRSDAVRTIKNDTEHKVVYKNLPKTDTAGNNIEYSVKENVVEAGFEANVTEDNEGNIVVTNTYKKLKEDTISVTLKKVWVGGEGNNATFNFINKKTRDAQIVLLSADNKDLIKNDDKNGHVTWTYEVKGLRKYDDDANIIDYIVEEVTNNAYTLKGNNSIEVKAGDTATFTNVRVESKLTLEKKWIGEAEDQAKFNIEGGGVSKEITLTKNKKWKESVDLPVYDLEGKVIVYKITEEKIKGYKADEYNKKFTLLDACDDPTNASVIFINTKMLDKKFTVYKNWDGTPATSVSFGLYDGKKQVDKLTLNSDETLIPSYNEKAWTGTFTKELPEYKLDEDGKPVKIKYVVKELNESGEPVENEGTVKFGDRTYKVESNSVADNNTFNFTNTDITTGDITYTKVWKGAKSDEAKFGLFVKDGNGLVKAKKGNDEISPVFADAYGNITFKGVDFAKYSAGDYVVRELDKKGEPVENEAAIELNDTTPGQGDSVVKKYQVTYDDDKRIITNTELIDITVTKTWGENVPQSERKSVEVDIYAGNERKKTVELKAGKWEDTVTNLPYLPDGYTVKEVEINGIEVNNDLKKLYKVEGEKEKIKETSTINITNSFDLSENKEGKINVLKQWTVDPKIIKVKLYKKTAATTTESSKWVEAGTEELNGYTKVLKTAFDKDEGSEKYQILETAVGTDELTEDDIQNILSSKTESPIEYKIGEYEVTVHNLGNDTFFIKNTQDSTMKELVVEKKWSDNTLDKYKEAVQVQLYKVENNKLVPVEESRYLDSSNWKTKFKGLRIKDAEGKNIDYRVAEVVVGNTTKTNLTLEDLQKGYKIGSSTVTIGGNNINTVVITNDVNLRDISVKKAWEGTATAGAVEITLYKKVGDNLESVETKQLNSEGKWMADFERQPKVDEEGVEIEYQIFETAIDGVKINIDPTKATGYKPDEQGNISYSTGTINDGSYSVVITGNSKDNNFVVKNSFTRNPVLPVIPGEDTPGGTPVIPVVTPDPLPTPTPNPSTPVVDVPNDPSPQGPATPVNDGDEDNGVTEIDEDDVPQGDGKEVKKDNKANKDTVDITDNKAPKGTANLPKTGGEEGNFLPIIGLGLIGLGLVIRRRR